MILATVATGIQDGYGQVMMQLCSRPWLSDSPGQGIITDRWKCDLHDLHQNAQFTQSSDVFWICFFEGASG